LTTVVPAPAELTLVNDFLATRREATFRALYRAHTPALYALALRLAGGDRDDADDLVQESWMRAVQARASFRADSALRSWLAGFLVNIQRERLKYAWREVRMPVDQVPAPTRRSDASDIERMIAILPDGARAVLVLHDVEGYKHREIAGLLGISTGTSKSQLARARTLLRSSLSASDTTSWGGSRT
jgi:RNA polymerase sigma factor (sigma-70 family)